MATLAAQALANQASTEEVARAAVKDAVATADVDEKKELAEILYKEATGRFPQDSNDRRAVYVGAFILVGGAFLVTAVVALWLTLADKSAPEWLSTLATALIGGVIGGLFGYAQQK